MSCRLGGDEFAVIATEVVENGREIISERLQRVVRSHNEESTYPFKLGLSIGIIQCDPPHIDTVVELLKQADETMYENKRAKRVGSGEGNSEIVVAHL